MNKIPASVFILCIVELQESCYKYGYSDYSVLAELLMGACKVDGIEEDKFLPAFLGQIRNKEPFLSLDLSQESYVYSIFKQLR